MPLSAELQKFVEGPAEIGLAKNLTYDRPAGLALVAALVDAKARSHLEALGEVASDKEVKKAARAAAYKLKSAGVAGGVQREASVDLSLKIETTNIAAAAAPGLDGRLWLVLPALPGAGGGEIDLREVGRPQRIEPINELSLGRVRKFVQEMKAEKMLQPLTLVGLDLAARLVDMTERALGLGKAPVAPALAHFTAWKARATALGARPEAASARAALDDKRPPVLEAIELVSAHPLLGFIAAPPSAFEGIDKEFRALLHGQDTIEKADFMAQAEVLVTRAAGAWAETPSGREVAALWMEATADVLWSTGDAEATRAALALADELVAWNGTEPLAHPIVKRAFQGAVDLEAAWTHREAHMKGEAHHDHGGHD